MVQAGMVPDGNVAGSSQPNLPMTKAIATCKHGAF